MGIIIGIDASRNRSGGAVAHLKGILANAEPENFGIEKVHLWTYKILSQEVPDRVWLVKHTPEALEKSLIHKIWWQYFYLSGEIKKNKCNLIFNTDAGSVSYFKPAVTLSQDMLPFEVNEMKRYLGEVAIFRLLMLRIIHSHSLKKAEGAIFLTKYASIITQKAIGDLKKIKIIPHGIGEEFHAVGKKYKQNIDTNNIIQCLYVSNTEMYKHQWQVVKAVGQLRELGYKFNLTLVGGGKGRARRKLERQIATSDPKGEFVKQVEFIPHEIITGYLAKADIFIFASSCENMPITLLEAMACGLPVACSDRGPMPEVLQDGGVYFDPENAESIKKAVLQLLSDTDLYKSFGKRAKELAEGFTWLKCAEETFSFLSECARQNP